MTEEGEPQKASLSINIAELVPALAGEGWRARLCDRLHRVLGIFSIHEVFSKARDGEISGGANLFSGVISDRNMQMDCADLRTRIPSHGSLIVVANHAFGGADAMSLSAICAEVRSDTKVLANAMVSALPGMDKWTIPLRIMGESGSVSMNRMAMKASLDHLRSGGLLVVFPAGAVARWRNDLARIADPEWSPHIVRLSTKTGSPVLPVCFFGNNPLWFELLGSIHPMMRSALIIRAFLSMKGRRIEFRAGVILDSNELSMSGSAEEATQHMREAVESIKKSN